MKPSSLPLDLKLVEPSNTTAEADRKFWALRELQDIIKLPSGIQESTIVERGLLDDTTGERFVIAQIQALPELAAVALTCPESPLLHIFVGSALRHRVIVDLGDRIPQRMSANLDEIVLQFFGGEFGSISIAVLWAKSTALVDQSSPYVDRLTAAEVEMRCARPVDCVKDVSGFLPFHSTNGKYKLLFWRNAPFGIWTGEWGVPILVAQPLKLLNDAHFLSGLEVRDACYLSESRRVYLADAMGGRVLEINPNEPETRLRVIAGDGVCGDVVRFGAAQASRLGKLVALCEFRIPAADAKALKELIDVTAAAGSWLRPGSSGQGKRTAVPKRGSTKLVELLQGSPFLLALNLNGRDQASAVSVSLPRNSTPVLTQLPDSSRRVLPLLPFVQSNASPLAIAPDGSVDGIALFQAPGLGVGIYQRGQSTIRVLESKFHVFLAPLIADKERAEKLRASLEHSTTPCS